MDGGQGAVGKDDNEEEEVELEEAPRVWLCRVAGMGVGTCGLWRHLTFYLLMHLDGPIWIALQRVQVCLRKSCSSVWQGRDRGWGEGQGGTILQPRLLLQMPHYEKKHLPSCATHVSQHLHTLTHQAPPPLPSLANLRGQPRWGASATASYSSLMLFFFFFTFFFFFISSSSCFSDFGLLSSVLVAQQIFYLFSF